MDVYDELIRLRRLGQKCAIATIVQVRGSIPSFESAKLLVREDGSMIGTIGGGCVEAEVWNAAREVMETEKSKHMSFNLGQDAAYDNGLICVAMIGSKRKVISVVKELEKEGLSREQLSRIYAPMGLEIGAISPEEIAIAVAAEMIAVRRGPASNWRALSMSIFADESLRALVK